MQTASYTTVQLAKLLQIKPQSLRNSLYEKGHWRGITPTKHPITGRLYWSKEQTAPLVELAQG